MDGNIGTPKPKANPNIDTMHHGHTFKAPEHKIDLHLRSMVVLGIPTLWNNIPRRLKGCSYPRYENIVINRSTKHTLKMQTLWRIDLGGEVKIMP